jgi:hypothetical protein
LNPQTHDRLQAAITALITFPLPPGATRRQHLTDPRKDDDA